MNLVLRDANAVEGVMHLLTRQGRVGEQGSRGRLGVGICAVSDCANISSAQTWRVSVPAQVLQACRDLVKNGTSTAAILVRHVCYKR